MSTVTVAGLGGLGTAVCISLARAGVGHLVLIDFDHVRQSDLNRQILYCTEDIGLDKVEAAAKRLLDIRPSLRLSLIKRKITKETSFPFEDKGAKIVADCLDNLPSRFVLDKMCRDAEAVLIHAGIDGLFGQVTTILPDSSIRLADIYAGVTLKHKFSTALCSSCMVVGAIQALEIINYILKGRKGLAFAGRLLSIDLYNFSLERLILS